MSIGGQQDQCTSGLEPPYLRHVWSYLAVAHDTMHFNAPTHFNGHGQAQSAIQEEEKSTAAQKVAKLRNIPSNKENIAPSASTALPPQKPVAPPKDWKHEFQKLQRRHRYTKTRQKKLEASLQLSN
ncbi:hypothetical protein B0H13DRAFT_1908759 [Mycena leptocephala]|nr:hypothetical protein B0H13DRAFT_1908759 [Mycena leptocephala]